MKRLNALFSIQSLGAVLMCSSLFTAAVSLASPASGFNTIKIKMRDTDFQTVIVGRGKKVEAAAEISFNGGPFQKSEIESRGQSCLTAAKRPCLGIKTENKVQFLGANGLEGKTFNRSLSAWNCLKPARSRSIEHSIIRPQESSFVKCLTQNRCCLVGI